MTIEKTPPPAVPFTREERRSGSALFRKALRTVHAACGQEGLDELTEPDPLGHHAMLETLQELETQEQTLLCLYHAEAFDDGDIGEVFGWQEDRAQWMRQRAMSKVRRGWTMRLSVALGERR